MHSPLMNGSVPFSPVWSGISDSSIRPALICIKDGSGYRPASQADFVSSALISSGISVTGVVAVDAVAISGANGLSVNVISVSGYNAFPVFLASGSFGSAGGSSSVAIQATKPSLPSSFQVYAINLTGTGSFSNYAPFIPNVTGNPIQLSVEPSSNNSDLVYYSFSGTADTGNAFELRGDKTFFVSSTTGVFFAQTASGNRVMIHIEAY